MSSAGHILDMINRIKQNKSLRKRKKFKGDYRDNSYSEKFAAFTEYDFPELSDTELDRLKIRMAEKARTYDRKSICILLAIIAVVAIAFWFFIQNYSVKPY